MGVMRPDMIMYLVSWACCQEGMVVVVVVVFVVNVGKFPRLNWFCEKSQKETENIKANCRHQQILETAANRPLFFLCLLKINQAPGYEQWTRKATISSLVRLYCLYLNMSFNCRTNKLCLCIFMFNLSIHMFLVDPFIMWWTWGICTTGSISLLFVLPDGKAM